jgi:hypothetical protein
MGSASPPDYKKLYIAESGQYDFLIRFPFSWYRIQLLWYVISAERIGSVSM